MHLADVVLDRLDDAVDEGLLQLDVAQAGDDLLLVGEDLLLEVADLLVAGREAVVELLVELALLLENGLDLVEQQDDARALVHFVLARIVLLDGLDHVLELDAVLAQLLADVDQLLDGNGHFHQGVEHVLLAELDLLGDHDFPVPVQQRHGAHLAQVHAHRIRAPGGVVGGVLVLGDVDGLLFAPAFLAFGGDAGGNLLAFLLGIDDDDFQLLEDADDFLELLRRAHLDRQGLVDFLEGEVAAALALGNERLNLLDVFEIAHFVSVGVSWAASR